MEVTVEKITPAKAEKLLNKNKLNRKLRNGIVEKYAADMRNGKWTHCTDPIAFYEGSHDIADGQHRLWAIVETKIPQTFIVVRGLDRASGLNIDTGFNRSLVDAASISGVNDGVTHLLIAVTRAVATGLRGDNSRFGTSNATKLGYIEAHGEAARWAIEHGPKTRAFAHSLVLAAIARAWYHEDDKERLIAFCHVLTKGFMDHEGDSAAVALRNMLVAIHTSHGFGSRDVWRDAFLKAQNAIKYFMKHKPLKILKSVQDEVYPLPTERKARKAA